MKSGALLLLLGCVTVQPGIPAWAEASRGVHWGTPQTPFHARSLWNSRPVSPVLGTATIPESSYPPAVQEGPYSTGVFVAGEADPPVVIYGKDGTQGVWDPDSGEHSTVTIPRWPRGVTPASGSDGNAEIVDPVAGIVHSFWQLRETNGRWSAAQHAWTSLRGSGWPTPAHYFQGSRATGVSMLGGLIRRHEVHDGQPLYRHALAMSLTYNGLSGDPAFVYPATSADGDAARTNTGAIPQGSRLFMPPTFDITSIHDADLRRIARTLQVYGAYVVDRNHGTPFVIYVEAGAGLDLHRGGWSEEIVRDLQRIRAALRPMSRTRGPWLDGDGTPFFPSRVGNLLSLRGPWRAVDKGAYARYDSARQALTFRRGPAVTVVNDTGSGWRPLDWARPIAGSWMRLVTHGDAGISLRLQLVDAGGKLVWDSQDMRGKSEKRFQWPEGVFKPVLRATKEEGKGGAVRIQ